MEAAVLLPGSTALSFYIQYSSCGPVGCCPILPYWLPQYLCQGRTSLLCRIPSNSASTTFWHAKLSEPRWHAGAPVHPGALAMPSEGGTAAGPMPPVRDMLSVRVSAFDRLTTHEGPQIASRRISNGGSPANGDVATRSQGVVGPEG